MLAEILINLRFQSICNLCLAAFVIVLQLSALIAFPTDVYEKAGTGFWTGIIFAATGLVTWRSIENYRYSKASLMLAFASILCGIILVGVYAESLHNIGRCQVAERITNKSSSLCPAHVTLNVFSIVSGLMAFSLNILLAYSTRLFFVPY